jgi:hypothetical protein
MDQETSNEIAGQVNKAVSEFREEASKNDIAPIVKDLQRALEEQSQKTSTVEDYMQSSVESEKAAFADITRLSNSLGGILETQRGILESLKGLNDNIDTASQKQNTEMSGGAGNDSLGGGVGGDLLMNGSLLSGGSIGSVTSAMMGGGGYGGGSLSNSEIPNVPEITPLDGGQARQNAEEYLGREMSDEEYNYLIRATSAEAAAGNNANPLEQAGVMASILNRAREEGDNGVIEVLKARNQFQAVTGTRYDPGPSDQFLEGPGEERLSSIENSSQLLSGFGYDQKNFTAADPNAYGPGTNIKYRDNMLEAGGTVLGGSVFNTSPNFSPETENPMLTPLSLNWVGEELPEGITEGLNQTTLSDPISGESFSVEFEVENDGDKFITTGPVTLTEDTDLEGVSGVAGDAVEVSAEMAQDLAGQIGATIDSSDLETPADLVETGISDSNTLMPEVTPPSIDLEAEPTVVDDASTAERNTESQAQPPQTASADYRESRTTPTSLTEKWHERVSGYYE